MADHRQQSAIRRLAGYFSPRGVPRAVLAATLFQFLVFGVGLPLTLFFTGDLVAAGVFAILGVFGSAVELWLAAARQRSMLSIDRYEEAVTEYRDHIHSLAVSTPGGAPVRAFWKSHCGCVHVMTWDHNGWTREQVLELDSDCPLVQAHGDQGGHGV